MLIIFYTTTQYKNLLDLLPGNINRKIMEGRYHLEDLAHQKQNLINATDFVFLRSAFAEVGYEDFLEDLKGFVTLYPEKRITLVLQGEVETNEYFIEELIKMGIYNIATADQLDKLRAELAECVSPGGMMRYRPKAPSAPIAEAVIDPGEDPMLKILRRLEKAVSDGNSALLSKVGGLEALLCAGSEIGSASPYAGQTVLAGVAIDDLQRENVALKAELEQIKANESPMNEMPAEVGPMNEAGANDREQALNHEIEQLKAKLSAGEAECKQTAKLCDEKVADLTQTIEMKNNKLTRYEQDIRAQEDKMQKYAEQIEAHQLKLPAEQAHFDFECQNIHIGFIGAQERAGVTNTALAFAKWLADAGGDVAYLEENLHNHCPTFNPDNSTMESVATDFGYHWKGVDIHLKTIKNAVPVLELELDYHFIIHDFGTKAECLAADGGDNRERDAIIESMQMLVLVSCFKGYERNNTFEAFRVLKHKPNLILALNFVHEFYHEQLTEYFMPSTEGSISFIDYMPEPEFPLSNQPLFLSIVKNYI